MSLPRSRSVAAAAIGLSVVLLSGCGVARPGVAIDINGSQTSLSAVDSLVDTACEQFRAESEDSTEAVPRDQIRARVVQVLVAEEVAMQIAEENDLTPSASYTQAKDMLSTELADLDVDEREAFVDLNTASFLSQDIRLQVGAAALADEGVEQPTDEQALEAGSAVFREWMANHEIDIDPRFGQRVQDGVLVLDDQRLGVAVSDVATSRLDPEDLSYAQSLPAAQRCI